MWGDGEQTRSFCHVDDCVEGIHRLMRSDFHEPLNLGQRPDGHDQPARRTSSPTIAGMPGIETRHVDGPQGVRGRNSDNTRLRRLLGWEPRISLEEGLARTYAWIEEQVSARLSKRDGVRLAQGNG